MYKEDSVRQLLETYKVTLTNRKMQRRHRSQPYSYSGPDAFDALDAYSYVQEEVVPTVVLEIEEDRLMQMADKIAEFDDLMRDPETAKLLMEARFINRLKGR
jgi:hypothetical protein